MYYEEQAQPRGELQMEKGHLNTALLVGSGVATLAGGYFGVKFYQKRQQQLVDEFGRAMMFYVGDDKLVRACADVCSRSRMLTYAHVRRRRRRQACACMR
jgi:predicted lipoprotein with Yx(FWY)xxD motif